MGDNQLSGRRFRRIQHPFSGHALDLDPLLNGNLDQWPHLKELVQSYKADWLKDERKYGHYKCIPPPVFEQQIFEGPDTDVETELRLSTRHARGEDMDDEEPSTSGRHSSVANGFPPRKHLGLPPLPAYDPVFNWVTERAFIYGQRTSELPASLSPRIRRQRCHR